MPPENASSPDPSSAAPTDPAPGSVSERAPASDHGETPAEGPNPFTGIALKVVSVAVLMVLSASVKALQGEIPPGQVVFFRSFFALPCIVIWLMARGDFPRALATPNPLGHVWRSLAGVCAMAMSFMALGLLPLTEAVAIAYAAPLFITIFAALFLGERLRLYRMAAVGLGFCGVLLVMAPRFGAETAAPAAAAEASGLAPETLGAGLALAAALMAGLAQTFVRGLSKTETTAAIVFWFTAACTLISLATLPWQWLSPSAEQWGLLISAGVAGGIGQILLTSSYRYAEAAVIAPFEYVSMIFAVAMGYFLFGEAPTAAVIGGAGLVTLSGLLIIWRERRLGMERRASRAARNPPFA